MPAVPALPVTPPNGAANGAPGGDAAAVADAVQAGRAGSAGVILAVSASGAQTGSLLQVLQALPDDPGLGVVLTLRHREALDEAAFRAALGEAAERLVAARDGDAIVGGRIYLPVPNVVMTLEEGRLRTRPIGDDMAERGVIDSFLVSLAQDQDGNIIGLVLAGTGGEGTLGVAAIKEAGGLTMAEETPGSIAEDPGQASSPAGLVDFVLPVERIAERVTLHTRRYARLQEAAALDARSAEEAERLAQVATVLRDKTGHDFHGYKRATFLRRIQRRMQVVQAEGLDAYLAILRARPDEPQLLFNDLLIGVTQFFRDRREFEFLETHVIPKLFEGKGRSDHLRVWVLGCSTGEEAYSIAILLREHAAKVEAPPQIQIFASDIDGRALAVARVGRYSRSIARDLTPERLAKWFVEEGDTYSIIKELREMCIFSQHSIVKDPPFSRLDMVSCRNLLIYLGTELQGRVIPLFHFALRRGGFLFLGNAENVSRHAQLFEPLDRSFRIFRRIDAPTRILPDFPAAPTIRTVNAVAPALRVIEHDDTLVRRAERIAERYAPAYALVDDTFDVLHFSSKAGRFIHPASGAASLNLLNLVHGDLRLDLRGALVKAMAEGRTVQAEGLQMTENGRSARVDIVVEPAAEGSPAQRAFVVLFKDSAALPEVPEARDASAVPPLARDAQMHRLELDLRVTRERLQTMVEELQSTNEELKSSNEEYQSLNEELQSANEELQTSKEELQSVNEEVTTVNGELAHRVHELGRANSDLKNLLESTQIATVFLDNELRVTNYTPAAAEIFHLVETDIGRPISHIKSRVAYDEIQEDARRVVRTLAACDREVEDPGSGARYIVRVLPYRSVDNFIGGAVVTFTDVTPLTRAERARRESEERLRLVTDSIPQLVWTALSGGSWNWASRQWGEYTGQTEVESHGQGWLEPLHPDDREVASAAWRQAGANGVLDAEWRIRGRNGSYRWFHSRAVPSAGAAEGEIEWFGTSTDVHEMRELRERQNVLVSELQHRSRNLLGIVTSLSSRTLGRGGSAADFEDRLAALSRAQGLLSRFGSDTVELGALVRAELEAHAEFEAPKVVVQGPKVHLTVEQVQTFALALHELATNAVKYGALRNGVGRLAVTWSVAAQEGGGQLLVLDWVESGMQLEPETITRRGYGRELIEKALTYSLQARTAYVLDPDGVRCRIEIPID